MGEKLAFIGYGEAARAFVEGWGGPRGASAYDIKLDDPLHAQSKRAEMLRDGVAVSGSLHEATREASLILSVVTADQALIAAENAAGALRPHALYCDFNSVSPDSKRRAARSVEAAGGRYVDVAVMAPVHPALAAVPLIASGPHAAAAAAALAALGMTGVRSIGGEVGHGASIKMIRSVMVKGIEALTAECVVAAERAGVTEEVLNSLGPEWPARADYNLGRMLDHGMRRAAEMEEVANTLDALGIGSAMTRATIERQREMGLLGIGHPPAGLSAKIARILERKAQAA